MAPTETPPLGSGLVFVEDPARDAMQRFVLGADTDGETLWIDVGGNANTYGMLDETHRRDWQASASLARSKPPALPARRRSLHPSRESGGMDLQVRKPDGWTTVTLDDVDELEAQLD